MLNLGTGEVLVILLVALLVLGPEKLPEAARKIGQVLGELRRMSAGFQAELRDAMQEPVEGTPVDGHVHRVHRSDGMPAREPESTGGEVDTPPGLSDPGWAGGGPGPSPSAPEEDRPSGDAGDAGPSAAGGATGADDAGGGERGDGAAAS